MKISNNNYITIQGWMVNDLQLTGNELLLYALIYGFTQDEKTEYSASIHYMTGWLGVSKNTILRLLITLEDKNLIFRITENGKMNRYKISDITSKPVPKLNRCQNETGAKIEPVPVPKLNRSPIYIYNKKDISDSKFFNDEEVNSAFKDYLLLRMKMKCQNTERVVSRLISKLKEYAPDKKTALEVIDKACTSNWKDFYPLKTA